MSSSSIKSRSSPSVHLAAVGDLVSLFSTGPSTSLNDSLWIKDVQTGEYSRINATYLKTPFLFSFLGDA
jgi:hypothetical protein